MGFFPRISLSELDKGVSSFVLRVYKLYWGKGFIKSYETSIMTQTATKTIKTQNLNKKSVSPLANIPTTSYPIKSNEKP